MTAMLTVPGETARQLRKGLHIELGGAAQDLEEITLKRDQVIHTDWYEEPLRRFDAIRALLDEIGWSDIDPPAEEMCIDLDAHRQAVTRALETVLLVADDDMKELDAVEAERAKQGEPSAREATTRRVLALREFATTVNVNGGGASG
ncbi:MAG TPA: hypothetical protein VHS55_04515 [Solirubrobacteraceae bacterium]|jgi:hypothetical protein|nr:hypothetical protein [Solirubrobacteraceae bacterium]